MPKIMINNDPKVFKGKYFYGLGRRKTSISKVRLYQGTGELYINGKKITVDKKKYLKPLDLTSNSATFNVSVVSKGGGTTGWIDSINLAIARALIEKDKTLRQVLKKNGLLMRDPRKVERKKPGLLKARRAPQWSKR